jgi:MoaA/NifB/PqqE/SkfB family radical SAM enzyme
MHKDEYSPYKIVHHIDKLNELRNNSQCIPLQIQIIPSNKCNQKCSFCSYRMKGYPSNEQFKEKDILSYKKIIEILDDCSEMGVKGIQYTGGGEPLVHPRIKDIFKYTLQNNLQIALVTNGQNLDDETCKILIDASWVRISLDSSNPTMYKRIRKVNQFNKVIKNIKNLVKYRKECIIGVGYVVCKENWRGILKAAQLAKDLGVQNFRISASFTPQGFSYFDGFLDEAKELSYQAQELSDENFTVFNLFNDRIQDTFESVQDYDKCPIKELLTYIGADYNVYTCCTLAFNKRGFIGSLKEQSFKELWNSEQKIKMFNNHNPSIHCQHTCMFKNKNQFINYCSKTNPKHVDFI